MQSGEFAGASDLAGDKRLIEKVKELATKDAAQDLDVQKEVGASGDPAPTIGRQATAWYNAVQMRMVVELLSPGMQDGQEADLRTEVLRVSCHL